MKKKFNVTGLCMPEKHYMADISERLEKIKEEMYQRSIGKPQEMDFRILTNFLSRLCQRSEKPVVLMVDEADQAGNYQVLATFLGCLRDMYLKRDTRPICG